MVTWLAILLQSAPAGSSVTTFDLARPASPLLSAVATSGCRGDGPDQGDVVVCGRKRDQYRLPLPVERQASTGPVRGEAPTGMAAMTPAVRCGIFSGERHCSKREAAQYGYGKGRDPVTLLTGLARAAVDPDAD